MWHPGAFELYHSMLLHNRRTSSRVYKDDDKSNFKGMTKSCFYSPMWRCDGPARNAELKKTATITKEETIEFFANTDDACIIVDGKKYPVGAKITLSPGEHTVCVQGFKLTSFPAFYIKGDVFKSDRSYITCNENHQPRRQAGDSELYTEETDNPEIFKFVYERVNPVSKKEENGGLLFDFGKEIFGKVLVSAENDKEYLLCLGESYEEATDTDYSEIVVNADVKNGEFVSSPCAFRYIFVPNIDTGIDIRCDFEHLPLVPKASFK